jgi:uncharacterized protein
MDDSLLKILACPVCKVGVNLVGEALICEKCKRIYPIKDGIPVMLAQEARIDEKKK